MKHLIFLLGFFALGLTALADPPAVADDITGNTVQVVLVDDANYCIAIVDVLEPGAVVALKSNSDLLPSVAIVPELLLVPEPPPQSYCPIVINPTGLNNTYNWLTLIRRTERMDC